MTDYNNKLTLSVFSYPQVQTRNIRCLPDVLVINCEVNSTKEAEFWKMQAEVQLTTQNTLKHSNNFTLNNVTVSIAMKCTNGKLFYLLTISVPSYFCPLGHLFTLERDEVLSIPRITIWRYSVNQGTASNTESKYGRECQVYVGALHPLHSPIGLTLAYLKETGKVSVNGLGWFPTLQ